MRRSGQNKWMLIAGLMVTCSVWAQQEKNLRIMAYQSFTVTLPDSCHMTITKDDSVYAFVHLIIGNDTLWGGLRETRYAAGTQLMFSTLVKSYAFGCGNYKGPGFCEPAFKELPEYRFPAGEKEYNKFLEENEAYNKQELARLLQAKANLQRKISINKAQVLYGFILRQEAMNLIKWNREAGDGNKLEIKIEGETLVLEINRRVNYADHSFCVRRFSLVANFKDPNHMKYLCDVVRSARIKED